MVSGLALSVTCGDRLPLLSLRDIFPRSGGSLSSKWEPLAVPASFIFLPSPFFTKSFPFKEGLSAQGVSGVTGNFVAMPKALPLGELAR